MYVLCVFHHYIIISLIKCNFFHGIWSNYTPFFHHDILIQVKYFTNISLTTYICVFFKQLKQDCYLTCWPHRQSNTVCRQSIIEKGGQWTSMFFTSTMHIVLYKYSQYSQHPPKVDHIGCDGCYSRQIPKRVEKCWDLWVHVFWAICLIPYEFEWPCWSSRVNTTNSTNLT